MSRGNLKNLPLLSVTPWCSVLYMNNVYDFSYAGSVSHGTMRDEDLIPTFLDVLTELDAPAAVRFAINHGSVLSALRDGEQDSLRPGMLVECTLALFDALDECAPPGWHFGAIEGDGSDYGFWLDGEDYDTEGDD